MQRLQRLVLTLLLVPAACVAPAADHAPLDGRFALAYSAFLVEEMRAAGVQAGAFALDDQPDDRGQRTLTVESHDATRPGEVAILRLALAADDRGARVASATLDGAPLEDPPAGPWAGLPRWHRRANELALTSAD